MFPTKRVNHAIFIEGLPIECVETDLIKLLQPCGKVNAIMLHRHPSPMIPPLRPNSVSASVEFQSRENAEAAVYLLETSVIWGRRLSARMITPNAPLVNNSVSNNMNNMNSIANNSNLNNQVAMAASKALRSAQVHISYLTKQLVTIVTEQIIFDLFSTFGKVIEVSLKKKCVDTEMCIQNGYGFVHYPLTAEGIESALRAVETLHQVTINNISYDCSVSNQLKQVLFSTGHLSSNNVANSNTTNLTNNNTIGNKTHAWMDASAQDAVNNNSRFPSLFNNNTNNNVNNIMHSNHMNNNNNNSHSLFPSLSNGNLLPNHNNHHPANNMPLNNHNTIMNNINLFNHTNNNSNNSDAGSLTGRLSLHSGATSYQGGLSSDGTNSIGFSSLNSFSNSNNHNSLHLKNASIGDALFTHANQFSLNNNNNMNSLNGFGAMYSGASIGSGRSSLEDHSSAYHRSQYKSSTMGNNLYNNVPLIAEDDILFTNSIANNNMNNNAQSNNNNINNNNNNLGVGSAKLPGVFNKWF